MDEVYSSYYSQYPGVEVFREAMPLVLAGLILYYYYRGKISIVETLLYTFATEAYCMLAIGPTFNTTLIVGAVFTLEMVHRLLTGRLYIRRGYLLLLVLPLFSSLAVFLFVSFGKNVFAYPGGSRVDFYLRPLYFYLKTYLPLFAIGAKIAEDRASLTFSSFSRAVRRITRVSCFIALLQLLIVHGTHNHALAQVFGLQERYLLEQQGEAIQLRVQALFAEPKTFSAFLALAIPLLLRNRSYALAIFATITGILTISQTFWTDLGAFAVVFFLLSRLRPLRLQIWVGLAAMIGLFMLISGSTQYLFNQYMANQQNPLYKLLFERSVSRYDVYDQGKENVILGLPLQEDLEFPVVRFLTDNPDLLLTGYGPGNSTFIPPDYFYGTQSYEFRVSGRGATNLNMRWLYLAAEFGLPVFCCFFVVLTRVRRNLPRFEQNYFGSIWICLFFSQIDIFFIIVALLSCYQPAPLEQTSRYEYLPG